MFKKISLLIIMSLLLLVATSTLTAASGNTIYDVAKENGNFTQLVGAVEAAGLKGTLESDGPFTVFAPTDDA
ncbi:MAG: fasciclin domain-containing protein, partial [Anaerolineae bacterium]|nr:fasciclin domain-containing protein [Anaerolineae bacterium]